MSRSRIVALILVNVVALIALLVGLFGFRSASELRPLTRVDLGSADRAMIASNAVVSLARSEGGWELLVEDGRYPARDDRIEPFLSEIGSAQIIRAVTDDPSLHADFGLTEALARRVVIGADEGDVDVLFGSPGDRPDTIYARDPEDAVVVLARAALDFYLRQPASFWAYLRLFPEDVVGSRIVRVGLRLGEGGMPASVDPGYDELELVRDARERWFLATRSGTVEASGVEVARFTRNLADLVGDGFYEGPVTDLVRVVSITFTVSDGREFSADVFTDGEIIVVNPDGGGLPGDPYGGLFYTLNPEKLPRIIPRATALLE